MARGFESKSVADQQESAFEEKRGAKPQVDPALLAKRRTLELSRASIVEQMGLASAPAHREMLRRALEDLDAALQALPGPQ
jgi:hypothetical protein